MEEENKNKKDLFDWTGNIENWGEKFWEHVPSDKKKDKKRGPAHYIFNIVAAIVILYVFNHLGSWHVPYLNQEWIVVLWSLNLVFGIKIFSNLLFLAYDKPWFKHLLKIVQNISSLLFFYSLYYIYPFNTSDSIKHIASMIFIICGAIIILSLFFHLFRLIFPSKKSRA